MLQFLEHADRQRVMFDMSGTLPIALGHPGREHVAVHKGGMTVFIILGTTKQSAHTVDMPTSDDVSDPPLTHGSSQVESRSGFAFALHSHRIR
jgi:hypothetical protein